LNSKEAFVSRASIILIAVVAAAVGGIAGAATSAWMHPGAPRPAASASGSLADYDDMSARLDSIEAQMARLAQQRATVIVAPAAPSSTQDPGGHPRAKPIDDPVFEAAVRDVVDRMEQDRNAERDARRNERQVQQAKRWADRLGEEASLNNDQKAKVLEIAQQYMEKLRQAGQADGGPVSREERNERRNAARADAEKQLGEALSPRQMQTFKGSEALQLDAIARGGTRRGGQ
jgi:hypothetical protein